MSPVIKGMPTAAPAVEDPQVHGEGASLTRLETFAKWIFGTVATVGTLATALGANGFGTLEGEGQDLFSWAIVSLALSLSAATIALIPIARKSNPNIIGNRNKALHGVLVWRSAWLWAAGLFFAVALALAGIAPMVSASHKSARAPVDVVWKLGEGRDFTANVSIAAGKPFGRARASARARPLAKGATVPTARVTLDSDGQGALALTAKRLAKAKKIILRVAYADRDNGLINRKYTIKLPKRKG